MEGASGDLPHIVCLLRDSIPLDQDEVSVCFDPERFVRKTNPAQEEAIASHWRRESRANPRLFNGSKFRYAGVRWSEGPELQLGLTSYREHVGTNLRCGQHLLQQAGAAVHGDRQAFLADPLAVGALLLTADNRVALVRRALWVGEYAGRLDRPGGHAEPDEIPDTGDEVAADARHQAALSEVFESVRREVRDELGVPLTHLSRAYLAGILRDKDLGGRPTLEFIIRCSLPSTELERLYNEGKHCEADESLGLVLLTKDELFSAERAVLAVPDLAGLEVEYPWQQQAQQPCGAVTAAVGETAVPTAAEPSCRTGAAQVTANCDVETAAQPVANCDAETAAPPVANCDVETAVPPVANCDVETAAPPVANCDAETAAQPVANCDVETAAPPVANCGSPPAAAAAAADPPAVVQPPAKPRQQPPKKKRRNRKDKRAAGRAEAPPPAVKPVSTDSAPTGKLPVDVDTEPQPAASSQNSVADAGEGPSLCPVQPAQATSGEEQTASSVADASPAPADVTLSAAGAAAAADSNEIVIVQQNGVVLLQAGTEVTETTMPTAAPPSERIETLAEVVNNPEGAEPVAAEKTAEELEREKKAALWEQMTPGCKASLILLKAANLKGFVFRF